MTDLTVDEDEARSPWKRIFAILCVVGLVFAMVIGGLLAVFMGVIAPSAGRRGIGWRWVRPRVDSILGVVGRGDVDATDPAGVAE